MIDNTELFLHNAQMFLSQTINYSYLIKYFIINKFLDLETTQEKNNSYQM